MLEHLLGDGVPRRAKKILANGAQARATVVGIRVRSRSNETETDRWEYALDVDARDRSRFRAGVRQQLVPQRERVHLGAEVIVRHDDDERVVIDWTASMAAFGVPGVTKSANDWSKVDPPADGIEERRGTYKPPKGASATAELIAVAPFEGMFGAVNAWNLDLRVDGRDVAVRRGNVPAYAVHLLVPGATLAAIVAGDETTIDWPRSAVDAARAGRPVTFDFDAMLPAPPGADEVLDYETWIAERELER